MTCTLLILPVISILNLQAQDTEYKDAPYFTGMPTYVIDYAEDIEFDSTRFFNGINCPIVEGKKYLRLYVLKEGATQASQLQIVRNYSNALKSIGGTVFINGVYDGAKCPDLNDLYMMVGKVVKDGNEVWVEVLPENNGANYRLTEVIKGVMKQDITATDMLKTNIRDSHKALPEGVMKQDITAPDMSKAKIRDSHEALPVGDINLIKSITPLEVTDIDGNVYKTITIGTQVWMAENLKTTKYSNGTEIPLATNNSDWMTPDHAYCWYNNDISNKNIYGALYKLSWDICPIGWHLPGYYDWITLVDYIGGYNVAGGKLKETGTVHWTEPNTGATNETGFTALPGGIRKEDDGNFIGIGNFSYWWTGSEDTGNIVESDRKFFVFTVNYDNSRIGILEDNGNMGLSVRCIKND